MEQYLPERQASAVVQRIVKDCRAALDSGHLFDRRPLDEPLKELVGRWMQQAPRVELEIRTRATLLTPVRIRFDYEVIRVADNTASASGHSVHAALNPAGRPCRLPERVLQMLDRPAGQPGAPTVYN